MLRTSSKRVFIFGAGFSKPAGMPLATGLLPLLISKLKLDDMREWLDSLRERLTWLAGAKHRDGSFTLNIEQVFHHAHFDVESHRLRQHLVRVGRGDGSGTPWNQAESVQAWLSYLEEALRDVILNRDDRSDLAPICRWARIATPDDSVLTFNYDTLVERALTALGKAWNHGTQAGESGVPVFKLHGSVDWIVAHRSESFPKLHLLFDKVNTNRRAGKTGHVEEDYRLWRCRTRRQLREWIRGRDLQIGAAWRSVGIAGLGAHKELHRIPGLGYVWAHGMAALYKANLAIVVGFSMSDFDVMAQMQFAEVARARFREKRPLRVIVIDPFADTDLRKRFRRVFRRVRFLRERHEKFLWSSLD